MGLFDQVMSAIQEPQREASLGQMGQIMSMAQQIARANNADANTTQQAASVIGGFVRSALKEKRETEGEAVAEALVQQGARDGAAVIPQLFNGLQQQQMSQTVSQKTGLDVNQVQSMLPVLIPLVMKFLSQGSTKAGVQGGGNPLMSAFLDGDGDGDVDMGDMLSMAGRFM
ncbi:MAG: DUF937 domain-containing protein [Cyanobacteria bacterium P01_A01_bin.105]